MHRAVSSLRRISLIAPLAAVLSGCWATWHEPKFNHNVGASGAGVLAVPFQESKKKAWYGESSIGHQIISALKVWAQESGADAYFVEGSHPKAVLTKVYDWTEESIYSTQWKELCEPLEDVEYVLEGDLVSFRLRKPTTIGIYDAEAVLHYRVINAKTGRIVRENKALTATVGRGDETRFVATTEFDSEAKIRQALVANLGRQLGEELYGYYEE